MNSDDFVCLFGFTVKFLVQLLYNRSKELIAVWLYVGTLNEPDSNVPRNYCLMAHDIECENYLIVPHSFSGTWYSFKQN